MYLIALIVKGNVGDGFVRLLQISDIVQHSLCQIQMASVKLILGTHLEDATGHSPFYIRIIKDNRTKFQTTGVKPKASEWAEEKQQVKKSHPDSAKVSASPLQKIADTEVHVADI